MKMYVIDWISELVRQLKPRLILNMARYSTHNKITHNEKGFSNYIERADLMGKVYEAEEKVSTYLYQGGALLRKSRTISIGD